MKFRNPETEKIYNLNEKEDCISSGFCREIDCFECPIYPRASQSNSTCKDWVLIHLFNAAALMGYEIIDDNEENNMNKPKICEILGVEIGEEFKYKFEEEQSYDDTFKILTDGKRYRKNGSQWEIYYGETELIEMINHPERIIRKPQFTQQDFEDAKIILRCYNDPKGIIERHKKEETKPYSDLTFNSFYINQEMFPSIREGEKYPLNEILNLAPPIKKPYGGYTLKETREICVQQEQCGENCPFWTKEYGACEMTNSIPENWEFPEEN